jgi:hypothetical protein
MSEFSLDWCSAAVRATHTAKKMSERICLSHTRPQSSLGLSSALLGFFACKKRIFPHMCAFICTLKCRHKHVHVCVYVDVLVNVMYVYEYV